MDLVFPKALYMAFVCLVSLILSLLNARISASIFSERGSRVLWFLISMCLGKSMLHAYQNDHLLGDKISLALHSFSHCFCFLTLNSEGKPSPVDNLILLVSTTEWILLISKTEGIFCFWISIGKPTCISVLGIFPGWSFLTHNMFFNSANSVFFALGVFSWIFLFSLKGLIFQGHHLWLY